MQEMKANETSNGREQPIFILIITFTSTSLLNEENLIL